VKLNKSLTLKEGIPLAIGSIIGSGVLFLPSLTVLYAKTDVVLAWLLVMFLCVPLLIVFFDIISKNKEASGIEGYIRQAFGSNISDVVPILLLCTVTFGMPASAVIATDYIVHALKLTDIFSFIIPYIILVIGIGVNLLNFRSSTNIQSAISWGLIAISCSLIFISFQGENYDVSRVTPTYNIPIILGATGLAFWAFAGFENLTFMAGEFKNPKVHLFASATIAIFVCGLIYLLLSYNIATNIPFDKVERTVGLLQLSEAAGIKSFPLVISLFALVAVLINFVSWCWGISRLIYSSAVEKLLPSRFAKLSANAVPSNALYLLLALFTLNLSIILFLRDSVFDYILSAVSCNFVLIYIITVAAYIKLAIRNLSRVFGIFILVVLLSVYYGSGAPIVYGLFVVLTAWIYLRFVRNVND